MVVHNSRIEIIIFGSYTRTNFNIIEFDEFIDQNETELIKKSKSLLVVRIHSEMDYFSNRLHSTIILSNLVYSYISLPSRGALRITFPIL